jgi:hypothetical protein
MSVLISGAKIRRQMGEREWAVFQRDGMNVALFVCPSCFAAVPNQTYDPGPIGPPRTAVQNHIEWHGLIHDAIEERP